jgi:hypothetical protein
VHRHERGPRLLPRDRRLIGTSAALAISDIPWNGPVGALKVGLVDGKLVFNPTSEQRKVSDLDVTVVSTGKKVVMIEAGANEVPTTPCTRPSSMAHEENQKQIALINQMVAEIGKPKFDYPHADFNEELFDKIVDATMDEAKAAMDTDDKNVREARWNQLIEHWHEKFLEEYPDMDQVSGGDHLQVPEEDRQGLAAGGPPRGRPPEERDPPPGRRGRRAAPRPRLRPVHPRPDAGALRPARWTPSPPTRSWTPSGRRRRSAICTTITSPATPWARPSHPAAPAAARSATALWPSAPCCR